ncbi:hypothetical protein ACIPY3_02160 [Paenarthrobacter sp. NPDC089714]|uniref:hypothetical protein n=1 Tax=Paenarthrobacter sp. NPDC089714 TaxID=3364377 RepID=UPI0037FA766C
MPERHSVPGPPPRRKIADLRHSRNPGHLDQCTDCRLALRREQQYLERLRDSAVPQASEDLTQRLLQRTQHLAGESDSPFDDLRPASASWRGLRLAGVAAGTLAVSAGALAMSAYAVAGDPIPEARAAASGSVASVAGAVTGGPAELMVEQGTKTVRAVSLGPEQLASLREQGWACPELSAMGFHVISAEATLHNGHPAVELKLESNGHHATVLEEHLPTASQPTTAQLTLTQGSPWGAVYRTPSGILSYSSDLPAEKADDAVPELVRAADAMAASSEVPAAETWSDRLLRGLRTLLRPAGL